MNDTLEQAALKLKSAVVEDRVGAAKLLGKYPSSQVSLLLISALDDSNERVRRAALVSLVEHFNNGFPVYESALAEKIFSKIGDPDVEVRRETSALIPRLVPGLLRSGVERAQVNGRFIFRSIPKSLRQDLEILARQALLDSDSIVRQNVLKHHFSLRLQIDPPTFVGLLGDQDVSVLLVAMDQVRIYASLPGVLEAVQALTEHPDLGVRSKLVRTLQSIGRAFPQYAKVLGALTQDPVDEIAVLAVVDLVRWGEKPTPSMVDRMIGYFMESKGFHGTSQSIFYSLGSFGREAEEIYLALTDHPSSGFRAKAWERYLALTQAWERPESWMSAMNDPDSSVREAVLSQLRGQVQKIDRSPLQELVENDNYEVRAFASELLLVADLKVVEELFFDLLIDESHLVRSTALRALAIRRVEGWADLHVRSLADKDASIQEAALDGLLGDREEGVSRLLQFIRQHPGETVSSRARMELERLGIQP